MKKAGVGLLMGAALALATPAMADQIQVGFSGSSYGPYQTGIGGEFTVNDIGPDGWLDLSGYSAQTKNLAAGITSFQTFCIGKTNTFTLLPPPITRCSVEAL